MEDIKFVRNDFDLAHSLASSRPNIAVLVQLGSKSIWWYIDYLAPFGYTFFDNIDNGGSSFHVFQKSSGVCKKFRPEWMELPQPVTQEAVIEELVKQELIVPEPMVNVEHDEILDSCVKILTTMSDFAVEDSCIVDVEDVAMEDVNMIVDYVLDEPLIDFAV